MILSKEFMKIEKRKIFSASIIVFIGLIFLAVFLFLLLFFSFKGKIKLEEDSVKNLDKNLENQIKAPKKKSSSFNLPPSDISNYNEFEPGKIGETKEKKLPLFIFNTTGQVKEVKEDRVIVLGSGSNFADQKPRILNLLFTENSLLFKEGKKYQGVEGLKHLEAGMKILIEGAENIRGKTQFKVKTIHVLK